VAGWHLARVLAPADMKAALLREGAVLESGSTLGHSGAQLGGADPSSVDEIGRPGTPGNRGEGTLNR
jgi:hypothetical protein